MLLPSFVALLLRRLVGYRRDFPSDRCVRRGRESKKREKESEALDSSRDKDAHSQLQTAEERLALALACTASGAKNDLDLPQTELSVLLQEETLAHLQRQLRLGSLDGQSKERGPDVDGDGLSVRLLFSSL